MKRASGNFSADKKTDIGMPSNNACVPEAKVRHG